MHKGHHNLANLFYLRGRGHSFLPENPNTIPTTECIYNKIETLKYQVNTFPPFVKPELIPYLMKMLLYFKLAKFLNSTKSGKNSPVTQRF